MPQPLPPNTALLPCSGLTAAIAALEVVIGSDGSDDNPNGTASLDSTGVFVDESSGSPTTVPEPSALALVLASLLPIGFYFVRKRPGRCTTSLRE